MGLKEVNKAIRGRVVRGDLCFGFELGLDLLCELLAELGEIT